MRLHRSPRPAFNSSRVASGCCRTQSWSLIDRQSAGMTDTLAGRPPLSGHPSTDGPLDGENSAMRWLLKNDALRQHDRSSRGTARRRPSRRRIIPRVEGFENRLLLSGGDPAGATLWSSSATPQNPADPDSSAVEVGVKFTADVAGSITGIRFYKDSTNTGTHVGNLWTADGRCWPAPRSATRPPRAGSRSTSPPRWRSSPTPSTSPRTTPTSATTPTTPATSPAVGYDTGAAACAGRRGERPQRRLRVRRPARSPPRATRRATTGSTWSSALVWLWRPRSFRSRRSAARRTRARGRVWRRRSARRWTRRRSMPARSGYSIRLGIRCRRRSVTAPIRTRRGSRRRPRWRPRPPIRPW